MTCKQCIYSRVCPLYLTDEDAEKCRVFINKESFAPKHEVAREILDEVEKIILENTYPYFDKDGKPCNIWKPRSGYDALDELKKKHTTPK